MLEINKGVDHLKKLVKHQLDFFMLDKEEASKVDDCVLEVLPNLEICFSHSSNKYYNSDKGVSFNPFHSSQYCIFLYKLSRALRIRFPDSNEATKVYLLNKMLHNCDLYHDVKLPNVFFLDHPLGAVMGKASYGEYFSFRQGCTVGNNRGVFPVIGENVKMWSNSKLLGDCNVGDNVILSANTYVKDTNIPANTIVFGSSPNLILKPNNTQDIRS